MDEMERLPMRDLETERVLSEVNSLRRKIRGRVRGSWLLFERLLVEAEQATAHRRQALLERILRLGLSSDAADLFLEIVAGTRWSRLARGKSRRRLSSEGEGSGTPDLPDTISVGTGDELIRPTVPPPGGDLRKKKSLPTYRVRVKQRGRTARKKGGGGRRRRIIRQPKSVIHKKQPPTPKPGQRVVNVHFTRPSGRAIPAVRPLRTKQLYQLRLDIGPVSSRSINVKPEPVRADLLPRNASGHWIKVAVVSEQFRVSKVASWLFLPTSGPSWHCRCKPLGAHKCKRADRKKSLVVSMLSPAKAGQAELRVVLYYQTSVVQSLLVTADVVDNPRVSGENRAVVDYNLTKRFADLSSVAPRALSVMMNDNGNGTHRLIFNGAKDKPVALTLSDGQMSAALKVMRTVMRAIHIEEIGNSKTNRFDANNAKSLKGFVEDLRTAAIEGARLWHSLWEDRMDEWMDNESMFVTHSNIIHIARKQKSTHVYPWAMVYDLPVDVGAPANNTLCKLLGATEWQAFQNATTFPNRCPFESSHGKNVICPFGFWGIRYQIEQPPSLPSRRERPSVIPAEPAPLDMIAALADDLDGKLLKAHLTKLASHSAFRITECRTRDAIRDGLGHAELELVYFYCHGLTNKLPGDAGETPVLGIGKQEMIHPPDLSTWLRTVWPKDHWKTVAPLVFINGCHTTDATPQTLVNFVDTFSGSLRAAGVIGTEITLHQLVANEVAQVFLDAFKRASVGDSLHVSRIGLLRKGNLLGLVYTAHCPANLSLSSHLT